MNSKLNIVDLLHIAYRWVYLLIAITILGGGIGYAYSYYLVEPTYTSTGNMYVTSVSVEELEENLNNLPIGVINASVRLATDYVEIIEYDSVLGEVAKACNSDVTPREIASMLKASMVSVDSPLIKIDVTAPDPYTAHDVAAAVLKVASKRLPIVADVPGAIKVVEEASQAVYAKTNPIMHAIVGLFAGFILGVLLVLFIELMDNRLKQTDDISAKYNLPVIGVVPTIHGSHSSEE